MATATSRPHIFAGVVLGIFLQPLSLIIVMGVITATTRTGTEERGWGMMGAFLLYIFYFGMAQVLTILPASLIFLFLGKQGITRGLLHVGTVLAVLNTAELFLMYFVFRWQILGGPSFPRT